MGVRRDAVEFRTDACLDGWIGVVLQSTCLAGQWENHQNPCEAVAKLKENGLLPLFAEEELLWYYNYLELISLC